MTLLDLAKRCGETIQVVAQAIDDEFKDKISLNSNTHVPDKYVSTIITKFLLIIPKMNIAWLLFWQDNGLSLQRLGILAIKSEVAQQNARPLFSLL